MEVRRATSEVEGGSSPEVMMCEPSEEMGGVCQYQGEGAVEG